MDKQRETIFWNLIKKLNDLKILNQIIIMGSWAEYLYSEVMQGDFSCSIQTRDIDFLYRNINKPNDPVPIIASLEADGYLYAEDFITGVSKFRYQDIIEIEFLTTALGSGHQKTQKISPLNITGESMRVLLNYMFLNRLYLLFKKLLQILRELRYGKRARILKLVKDF